MIYHIRFHNDVNVTGKKINLSVYSINCHAMKAYWEVESYLHALLTSGWAISFVLGVDYCSVVKIQRNTLLCIGQSVLNLACLYLDTYEAATTQCCLMDTKKISPYTLSYQS
jgi:hypothetical protein